MNYAQINYQDIQGINGRYTIHQIGCFITAFCNLLSRFNKGISPNSLNGYLIDHNIYTDVDDGVRDDVGWSTITSYDSNIIVTGIGDGLPSSNDTIVKFVYNSYQTGLPITHFCLVDDINSGTIIDSWDGQIKSWNIYGGPKAWASYVYKQSKIESSGDDEMILTNDDVKILYNRLLNRDPDPGGLANYTGKTVEFALDDMLGSQEFQDIMKGKYATSIIQPEPSATNEQIVGGELVAVLKRAINL